MKTSLSSMTVGLELRKPWLLLRCERMTLLRSLELRDPISSDKTTAVLLAVVRWPHMCGSILSPRGANSFGSYFYYTLGFHSCLFQSSVLTQVIYLTITVFCTRVFLAGPFLPYFSSWLIDSPVFWLLPLIRRDRHGKLEPAYPRLHISPTPIQGNQALKLAIVGVFTPRKCQIIQMTSLYPPNWKSTCCILSSAHLDLEAKRGNITSAENESTERLERR